MKPQDVSGCVFACFVEFSHDKTVSGGINAISERPQAEGKALFWTLEMSMADEALIGVTAGIKFSGCQSHSIAVHNSGHPDGSY